MRKIVTILVTLAVLICVAFVVVKALKKKNKPKKVLRKNRLIRQCMWILFRG